MAFKWRDSLATGITLVDDQHKELIKRTNDLLICMKTGNAGQNVAQVIDYLSDYVIEHFSAEEEVMKSFDYPNYPNHKNMHTEFIQTVNDLKLRVTSEKIYSSFVVEVNHEICEWLIDHILKQDKEMAQYVSNKRKETILNPNPTITT